MQCKVRQYKLVARTYGECVRVPTPEMNLIWDEDMYFPKKYEALILSEIQKISRIPIINSSATNGYIKRANAGAILKIQTAINNALEVWKKDFGLTNVRPTMFTTKAKRCSILIGDPLYAEY